jgi:AcrR family transcriptional regulator
MGAKRKPERRADVLNAMADYLLGSGLSGATLRPAAKAARSSPRMLLYHFQTKEELMVAALQEVRRRETELFTRALARLPGRSTDDMLRRLWRWYASPRRAPYLRVFFEAWGVSLREPYLRKGFLEKVRKDLLPFAEEALVQRGYPRRDASAIATFMIAAFRGLLLDLVANPDRQRLDDAIEIFALVTRTMEALGPAAASDVFAGGRPARPKARSRPTAPAAPRRRAARSLKDARRFTARRRLHAPAIARVAAATRKVAPLGRTTG